MSMRPIFAMVRKDLQLFFTDRRAVIMTMVAPIAIASFFGSIFSGNNGEPAKIEVAIVDQDSSPISKGILSGAQGDRNLHVTTPMADEARGQVKAGSVTVAVVIPAGFGDAAGRALFASVEKPNLTLWFDPSHAAELGLVRGIIVRSRSIVGTIGASLQSLVGGDITLYTELCEKARNDAFELMLEHAAEIGANAVIGARYDANEVTAGVTEVLAYGTAVTVERE